MTDYTKMVKPVVDKWNNDDIEAGYRAVYAELEKDGWDIPPYHKFRSILIEAGKGLFQPLRPTHLKLEEKEVQLARLIKVLHKHGYHKDGVDHTKADGATKESQKYDSGSTKTLEDVFGKYDKELSTNDFSVHTKDGMTHISFRGSRTNTADINTAHDWATNIGGHLGGRTVVKQLPQAKQMDADLEKVRLKLGDFSNDKYHFTGYSKGGGTLLGALHYGEKLKVDTTTFNPHVSNDYDLEGVKMKHKIIRTTEDPASFGLAGKERSSKIEVKSIPSLNKYSSAIGAHELDNMTEDGSSVPRQNVGEATIDDPLSRSIIPKIVTRFKAHGALKRMHDDLTSIDNAIELKNLPMGKYLDTIKSSTRQVLDMMPTDEGQEMTDLRAPAATTSSTRVADNKNYARLKYMQTHVNTEEGKASLERDKSNMQQRYKSTLTESHATLKMMRTMEQTFKKEYGEAKARLLIREIKDYDSGLEAKGESMTPDEMHTFVSDKINELERFSNREKLTTSSEPGTSSLIQSKMAATDPSAPDAIGQGDPVSAEDKIGIADGDLDVGKTTGLLPADQMKAYAQTTDDDRFNVREHLMNKIRMGARDLNTDYIQPYSKSVVGASMDSSTLRQRIGRGAGRFMNVRGAAAGGAGLAIGAAIGMAENYIPGFDNMNQYEASAITGGVTGAATELAVNKLTGIATTSIRGLTNVTGSILSGGVGLVVGDLATNAILGAFGTNANPYEKNMIADIAGGEIGLLAGLGIAGGVSIAAAMMTAATGEAVVAATNAWNPIGWGAAIGAGLTAIGGAIAGWFSGNAEAKAKAKQAQEKVEVGYAANADSIKSQYDFMRTYATELGMNPDLIQVLLQPSLQTALADKDVVPLTKTEMTAKLNGLIQNFKLSDGTYAHGTQTSAQQLTAVVRQKSIQNKSMLTALVTRINKAGGKAVMPSFGGIYDNQTFWTDYNKLIDANPVEAAKIKAVKFVIPSAEGVKSKAAVALGNILPESMVGNKAQVKAWEAQIITEGETAHADQSKDILAWKGLAASNPNLAPIYNKIIVALGGNPVPLTTAQLAAQKTNALGGGTDKSQFAVRAADIARWTALVKTNPSMAPALNGLIDAATMSGGKIDSATMSVIAGSATKAYSGTQSGVVAQSNALGAKIHSELYKNALYQSWLKAGKVYLGNRPIPASYATNKAVIEAKTWGETPQEYVNKVYARAHGQMTPYEAAGGLANMSTSSVNSQSIGKIKAFVPRKVPSSPAQVIKTVTPPPLVKSGVPKLPPKVQKASGTLAAARSRLGLPPDAATVAKKRVAAVQAGILAAENAPQNGGNYGHFNRQVGQF